MTYDESSNLMNDIQFRGRIKVACLSFATYIMNEPVSQPGHSSRLRWAQQTGQMPEQAAMQVQPLVVMDGAVQQAGIDENGKSMIADPALQSSVESVVNKII